ncbi:hypothetical protein NHX12_003633 [Muraenolepis orangiensis]|uniref:Cystatin fetuin-A-type domain-containing protein n=1 Tax=Muraenolepis orangiensis TaxID=630683 RepID=A0A9Q0IEU7_9TELE|nr:hypothetical protein NHX12_003633 [Muraenolepis orangiensis]
MRWLSIAVTLGLLLAVWAQGWSMPNIGRPPCDSPDVEAAATAAQDYLNAQHTHGYKYVLNRIDDVKIFSTPSGVTTYLLEVDLLETDCHVLDPTPLANCSVRPKVLTAVEGDCEVVLKKVGGALSVSAFKCVTEESREDICEGCPALLPLNHTSGLDFVHASLRTFNGRINNTYSLMEVGRMSSQLVSGGTIFAAEYVIEEAKCTSGDCAPLDNAPINVPEVNNTASSSPSLSPVSPYSLKHHKLTHIWIHDHIHDRVNDSIHDRQVRLLFESDSSESNEVGVMQVMPGVFVAAAALPEPSVAAAAATPVLELLASAKALSVEVLATDDVPNVELVPTVDVPAAAANDAANDIPVAVVVKRAAEFVEPAALVPTHPSNVLGPQCPGRIRHY